MAIVAATFHATCHPDPLHSQNRLIGISKKIQATTCSQIGWARNPCHFDRVATVANVGAPQAAQNRAAGSRLEPHDAQNRC
jgi:hypothetical protein